MEGGGDESAHYRYPILVGLNWLESSGMSRGCIEHADRTDRMSERVDIELLCI